MELISKTDAGVWAVRKFVTVCCLVNALTSQSIYRYTVDCTADRVTQNLRGIYCFKSWAFVCFWRDSPPSGPGPPHSRGFWITHNDAPLSVGLLWTSDKLVGMTCTWQHTTLTTDKHPFPPWDWNSRSQQASGRRPMPSTARPLGPALGPLGYLFSFFGALNVRLIPTEGCGNRFRVVSIVIRLRDGLSGVRIPTEERLISYNAPLCTGVRLASYVMGTGLPFRGGKSSWNLKLTTPPSSAEVKNELGQMSAPSPLRMLSWRMWWQLFLLLLPRSVPNERYWWERHVRNIPLFAWLFF